MIPRVPPPTHQPDLVIDGHPCHFVWHHPQILQAWRNADGTMSARIDRASVPSIPRGILVHHHDGRGGSCVLWLPWVTDRDAPDNPVWTLLSLHPLSLSEPFACRRCGMVGAIRDGQWWWWHDDAGRLIA